MRQPPADHAGHASRTPIDRPGPSRPRAPATVRHLAPGSPGRRRPGGDPGPDGPAHLARLDRPAGTGAARPGARERAHPGPDRGDPARVPLQRLQERGRRHLRGRRRLEPRLDPARGPGGDRPPRARTSRPSPGIRRSPRRSRSTATARWTITSRSCRPAKRAGSPARCRWAPSRSAGRACRPCGSSSRRPGGCASRAPPTPAPDAAAGRHRAPGLPSVRSVLPLVGPRLPVATALPSMQGVDKG